MLKDDLLKSGEFRDSLEEIIYIAITYHDTNELRSRVFKALNEFKSKLTAFELIDAIETIWEGANFNLYNGIYYTSVKGKLDEFLKKNGYAKEIGESNERP